MNNFYSVEDIENVNSFVEEAIELKGKISSNKIGKDKTLVLLFYNPSLRTRLSTQKAAYELGMHVISMNANEGWKWELESGAIMNMDKAEHIKDAAKVISLYADIIGIRAFPGLVDREEDYRDRLLQQFIQYADVPVINLESSILHPCQSLADLITIRENQKKIRNKIVVTWAPHPKALPQAVVNSFLEWIRDTDNQVVLTHPEGYELSEEYTSGYQIEYDQDKALENADFVYVKNWSSYQQYGAVLSQSPSWSLSESKWALTNQGKVMHCLPVRRNVVIHDSVLDGPHSLVYQQANNRTHAAKMILKKLL